MSVKIKVHIINGYVKDKNWSKIWEMLYALKETNKKNKIEEFTDLFFILHESLIYYSSERYLRFYLPRIFESEIFRLVYD